MKMYWISVAAAAVFLAVGLLSGSAVFDHAKNETKPLVSGLCGISVEEYQAEAVDYQRNYVPSIVTVGGLGDAATAEARLSEMKQKVSDGTFSAEDVCKNLLGVFTELGCFSAYYEYEGMLSQEIDGVIYGAYVAEGEDPIGGGVGYSDIFTTGDYVVSTLAELVSALEMAQSGEVVFIEGDADIDVTSVATLQLGEGVTLASDRGRIREDGSVSTGARIWSASMTTEPVIRAGDNSRVSGVVIDGRNPYQHREHLKRYRDGDSSWAVTSYYGLMVTGKEGITAGNGMRVDNCEILGFGHGGVHLPVGIKDVRVDHCYIHHNQTHGLGYGVVHNHGSESVIEYCLFNYNRHSIAGTGAPGTGYIARYNVEMGTTMEHCFDMHGGSDRGDGTNIAGTYCEMYNNTFLFRKTDEYVYPYWLRGVPEDYQTFHHNICVERITVFDPDRLSNERATLNDNIFGGELIP